MGSTVSPTHLIGKTVFPLCLHTPTPFRSGQASSSCWVSLPRIGPRAVAALTTGGGGQSDMLADRLRRYSEGSRPAAAKVQPVPGGPCQPELFLEAMFANFVLIVSLSKLWLPGLREGESLRETLPPCSPPPHSRSPPRRWLGLVGGSHLCADPCTWWVGMG